MPKLRQPIYFISHGGGPWPYIPEMRRHFAKTATWLSELPQTLPEPPKAVLSISAHWETREFQVSSAQQPPMIYDYSGFPPDTYSIQYKAPGSPELARRTQELLQKAGIACSLDATHGFDHGTFVPLSLMYPKADIPVVSMSILSSYDPNAHIRMGEALAPLREEGILILGSGLTFHNMRAFGHPQAAGISELFGRWLGETVTEKDVETRKSRLANWEKAPGARQAHPREDHLVPLMVIVGAAGEDKGEAVFLEHAMGVDMASYKFG